MKPLSGVRILDLTRVLAGPFCTAILADLGAEVIKVEPPAGDDYRHVGPFREGESALFALNNRGKKSIVLDLKSPEARDIALQLAAVSDVVIENFRPGVADRLGIGPKALHAANPALIFASISGFGQAGPLAEMPAYDVVVQAMSGWMDSTGEEGGGPLRTGEAIGDIAAGLYAAVGILAALVGRGRAAPEAQTGVQIDIAMLDCLVSMLPTSHALHHYAGVKVQRTGNRHPLSTPFGAFKSADNAVIIAVLGARQFAQLAKLMGDEAIASDPRFASDELRTRHEPELRALIERWTSQFPTEALVAELLAQGIPAAPILSLAEVLETPHAAMRDLVSPLPHHSLGTSPVAGQPLRFNGVKPVAVQGAPALGGDTRAVLEGLGLTATQIAGLFTAGIVKGADLA